MTQSLLGLKRATANQDVKLHRHFVLLEIMDGIINLLGGNTLAHVLENVVVKRLYTQVDVATSTLAQHLGNGLGDSIDARLTSPQHVIFLHYLTH